MSTEEASASIDPEQFVIDYLREHPDFFSHHTKLLTELNLPHASGKAISLVEHQVAIMRERNVEMRRKMNALLDAARVNDGIFSKTRSLTLALVEANSIHELNEVLATHVLVDFDADFVCCHLQQSGISLDHIQKHQEPFEFSSLLDRNTPVCTTLREQELAQIFPQSSHGDTGSAALLPLLLPGRWRTVYRQSQCATFQP